MGWLIFSTLASKRRSRGLYYSGSTKLVDLLLLINNILLPGKQMSSPGHGMLWSASCGQSLPPYCGSGAEQVLFLCVCPLSTSVPHVAMHCCPAQVDQTDHMPWIGGQISSPGHWKICSTKSQSGQSMPPYCGWGAEQERFLYLCPLSSSVPQGAIHTPTQSDQVDHTPLIGHSTRLQDCVSVCSPEHCAPPKAGLGSAQYRFRTSLPGPHVLEQVPHGCQDDQEPSTG